MTVPVLTIDGPSGSGKGTVSRGVAKQLGWHYLDSGSIYRSLAIKVLRSHVGLDDQAAIVPLAEGLDLLFECDEELVVKLEGKDITAELITETIGNAASKIAVLPDVRHALLQKQRDFQKKPGLVADGRDMGTVVFSNADYKVFLTASAEERGRRRYKQLKEKGIDANLIQITEEIAARDQRDQERETAPLMMADNALYIDSSNIAINRVIEEVLNLIR
jgi:cytidylate kinase